MTEEERKKYISDVNKLAELVKRRNEVLRSIELYERENRHVKDYLKLCHERMELSSILPIYATYIENQKALLDNEINYNLINLCGIRQSENSCTHPIWFYDCSMSSFGFKCEEESKEFSSNVYKCIECGQTRPVWKYDYKDFEKSNIVLKAYGLDNGFYEMLVEHYYSSLMDNSFEESVLDLKRFFDNEVQALSMKK